MENAFFQQPKVLRLTWTVMMKMRHDLRMNIFPYIGTAFANLHYYYRENEASKHALHKLIVAAFASSAKTFNCTIAYPRIFSVFLSACKVLAETLPVDTLYTTFSVNDFNDRTLTANELNEIKICEMELLTSHGLCGIRMPYDITKQFVVPYLHEHPDREAIQMNLDRNHCAILCSADYLSVPIEANALVATENAFGDSQLPAEVKAWQKKVTEEYSPKTIENARRVLETALKSVKT